MDFGSVVSTKTMKKLENCNNGFAFEAELKKVQL
jgi:hypothetical protein